MAKFGLLSGRVKVKSGADLQSDRYQFLGLDNAEPNLGLPASNDSFAASNTDGTRRFIAPGTGLTVSGNTVNVNESTLVIDSSAYVATANTNTNLAQVLSAIDAELDLKFYASDFTGSNILTQLLTVDGTGSLLDADKLDGQEGSYYLDWTNVTNKPDPKIDLIVTGDIEGSANTTLTDLASGTLNLALELTDTGVSAGTYGSASQVPQFTVDVDGRITSVTNVAVAGVSNVTFDTANGVLTIATSAGTSYDVDLNIGTADNLAVTSLDTDFIDLSTTANVAYQEGRVFYDNVNKALAVYNDEADVTLQVGQEEWTRVYNNTGATIANATPVRITGANGGFPTVALADATSYDNAEVVGLTTHAIENGTYGYITTRGIVRGIDTSALTAGATVHVGVTAGTLQTAEPTYPYWATEVGVCLVSSATVGEIYVNIEHYGMESVRTVGDARVGGDLTVTGDLTVLGTQSTVAVNNLSVDNNFIYLNSGDTIGASGTSFTGTGLNDAILVGHYTGTTTNKTFYVRISGVGTGTGGVDQFEWSLDNFSTTEATAIDITGAPQALVDGISVEFNATTGHTASDLWSGSASPVNVDIALIGNRNTGATGVGYTHVGIVFDTADTKWKVFDRLDSEPMGDIDDTANTFTLATFVADTFEGALTGNVTGNVTGNLTGNADTATKLATARTISLTGDVTGSATFDGSANASISVNITETTDGITEGTTNLYFTTARANTAFDARLATSTTDDLAEGNTNIYYTTTRANTDFDTRLATKSTDNLSEGTTNLYFTTDRANTAIDNRVTKTFVDALNVDADTLDGANGDFYLDYTNFTNVPTIGNATVTVSGNTGLSGTGSFNLNDTTPTSIEISHGNTSDVSNLVANSRTYVDGLTFDEFGHVTGFTTASEVVVNTTYTLDGRTVAANDIEIQLVGSDSSTDQIKFAGTGSVTVSWDEVNQKVIIDADVDTDNFVVDATFDTANNVLTLDRSGTLPSIDVDLSGITPNYHNLVNKPAEWSIKTDIATSGTGAHVIDTFNANDYKTVKYVIQISYGDVTPINFQCLEILLVHDYADVYLAQYAEIVTQQVLVPGISADIVGGQVRLLVDDTNFNNTSVRVTRIHV